MSEWFLKPPTKDDAIYSVGTACITRLATDCRYCSTECKDNTYDRINGRVRSQTKTFIAKIGSEETDTSILSEVEKATKNIIADVDVIGYKVSESSVVANGTQYRVMFYWSILTKRRIRLL